MSASGVAGGGGGGAGAAALTRTPVKTGNYAAASGDLVPADASIGSLTITLPNLPADKAQVAVKVIALTAPNTVTVVTGAADTFNRVGGITTIPLSLLAQGALFQYDAATKVWTVAEYAVPMSTLDTRFGFLTSLVESFYLKAWGHSFVLGTGSSDAVGVRTGYVQRLRNRLGLSAVENNGVSGSTSAAAAVLAAKAFKRLSPGIFALFHMVENDRQDGTAAKNLAKYANSLATCVLSMRAGGLVRANDARFTYSGFTSDNTEFGMLDSVPFSATAQGSTATITGFAPGERVTVILGGRDDATALSPGGDYSIATQSSTEPLTVVATGTTSNQFAKGRDSFGVGYLPVQVTVPATGTNQTIVVTKTDASGTTKVSVWAMFTGVSAPGAGILQVHVVEPPRGAGIAASLALYNNQQAATLSALGGVGQDIVIVDPTKHGWDPATCVGADGIHPNDLGHRVLAKAVAAEVATATYGAGRTSV